MGNLKSSVMRVCWWIVGLVAVARLGIAMVRFLQVDEMQILHLAWLRTAGSIPGVDHAFPQFSLLIDLLEPLWHLLGARLLGLWIARFGMWGLSLAIFVATGWLVHRLRDPERSAGSPAASPAVVGTLVCLAIFTEFNERVIEIRSDGALVLLWILAFGALARGVGHRGPRLAGGLTALAFAFNFKTVSVVPFLGLAALLPPVGETWRPRVAWCRVWGLALGGLAGLALYLLYLALRGDLALFVETLSRNLNVSSNARIRMAPGLYLLQSLIRNVPFYALFVFGLGILARGKAHALGSRDITRLQWLPPLLFSAAYVWLNPTFFPYNFVDVAPFWALAAGTGLTWMLVRLRPRWAMLLPLALLAIALPRLAGLWIPTLGDQIAVNRFAMAVTGPEDRVYDASGLILFRRGPYHWRLHSLMLPRYYDGEIRLWKSLQEEPWRLMVPSYRTEWLTLEDKAVVRSFFPVPHPRIGVLGYVVPSEELNAPSGAVFPILLSGRYRILGGGDSEAALLVDGLPYRGTVELEAGEHRLQLARPVPDPVQVAIVWSPEGLGRALAELPEGSLRLFYPFTY